MKLWLFDRGGRAAQRRRDVAGRQLVLTPLGPGKELWSLPGPTMQVSCLCRIDKAGWMGRGRDGGWRYIMEAMVLMGWTSVCYQCSCVFVCCYICVCVRSRSTVLYIYPHATIRTVLLVLPIVLQPHIIAAPTGKSCTPSASWKSIDAPPGSIASNLLLKPKCVAVHHHSLTSLKLHFVKEKRLLTSWWACFIRDS